MFETHLSAFRRSTLQIRFNGRLLDQSEWRSYGIDVESHGKITFEKPTTRINGKWEFRLDSSTAFNFEFLIFKDPSYAKIEEFIQIKQVGDEAEIHCHIDNIQSQGVDIRWYKRDFTSNLGRVPISQEWRVQTEPSTSHITKTMALYDQGEYICEATDSKTGQIYSSRANIYLNADQVCGPGLIPCSDGKCIHPNRICDGVKHCADDESAVRCGKCDPIKRRCDPVNRANSRTYNVFWKCDGEDDCGNNLDEKSCNSEFYRRCAPKQFECSRNSQRIPRSFQCDGEPDCADQSDETNCNKPQIFSSSSANRNATTVKRGATVQFECTASGNPAPHILWLFNWRCTYGDIDSAPLEYKRRYRTEITRIAPNCQSVTSRLTITDVQPIDTGIFNCQAISTMSKILGPDQVLRVN